MFLWIIQVTFLSILFIFISHSLIHFFKSTLTVPKIKDLVNTPQEKYKKMLDLVQQSNKKTDNSIKTGDDNPTLDMKNELKKFLKTQISSNNANNTTSIATLDSISNNQYYPF